MKKILLIVAHPHIEKSRVNQAIVDSLSGIDGVNVHYLYDVYPNFHINVPREQALVSEHDLLVMQHPFYWYSMPALMKLWLDEVLENGWAYGPGGDKLHGKDLVVSVTTGGGFDAYRENGFNRFTMDQFLSPWNQTAHICGMNWKSPLVFHRSSQASEAEIFEHADKFRERLIRYRQTGEWS